MNLYWQIVMTDDNFYLLNSIQQQKVYMHAWHNMIGLVVQQQNGFKSRTSTFYPFVWFHKEIPTSPDSIWPPTITRNTEFVVIFAKLTVFPDTALVFVDKQSYKWKFKRRSEKTNFCIRVEWALDKIIISNVQSGNKITSNVVETWLCNTDALYNGACDILRAFKMHGQHTVLTK